MRNKYGKLIVDISHDGLLVDGESYDIINKSFVEYLQSIHSGNTGFVDDAIISGKECIVFARDEDGALVKLTCTGGVDDQSSIYFKGLCENSKLLQANIYYSLEDKKFVMEITYFEIVNAGE